MDDAARTLELHRQREKAAADAMHRLKHKVLPELELVIAGTPTGPLRDSLTNANIILQHAADGTPIVFSGDPLTLPPDPPDDPTPAS